MAVKALERALDAFRRRDAEEAERLCRQVLASEPDELHALRMLAEVLAFSQRYGEAIERYRQIVQLTQSQLDRASVEHGMSTLRGLNWQPQGILDIGAHRGDWTRMARHFFPNAFVLMVEAQPNLKAVLSDLEASQPDKIAFRSVVLGQEARESVDFFQIEGPSTSGSSLHFEQSSFDRSTIKLPMVTLDSVVAEFPDRTFKFLKLDVQGAELDVLQGATSTLSGIEVILAELSLVEFNVGAPLFDEVVSSMKDLGFLLFDFFALDRHSSGALMQVDAFFVRRESPLWPKPPFL